MAFTGISAGVDAFQGSVTGTGANCSMCTVKPGADLAMMSGSITASKDTLLSDVPPAHHGAGPHRNLP
ncbi:hypothetical protein [Streptomyces xanthochromogenes]|uniref:hypothetical protein n=1 Tax=Streptomyces xanthochromogenes TaxID=67384 RepID=UPI001674955A|nr:hypothetical protein [Streptomyces xanthochromogenes]